MSNSSLVSYVNISPNKTSPRNHIIDTISIHCAVGQLSVETLGNIFSPSTRAASSNYGIGSDGRIGMYCEEKDRSWCTYSASNDNRAITIEVASDSTPPYKINAKAYTSLINLLEDICRRNNIKKLLWKADKSLIGQIDKQNMTVHRWFANKSCPGQYLYDMHTQIASDVNQRLAYDPTQYITINTRGYKVKIVASSLNYRQGPGTFHKINGIVHNGEIYTIIEEQNGWGRLKSGAGWINLSYTQRV